MKNKKMITKVLLLAFVISLVLPAGAFAADTKTASDLNGHWAEGVISQWMTDGLVGGYQDGTFQPDKSITRAEFVKLVNAAVKPNKVGAVNFSDVTNTDWFYDELRLAMGAGYVGGFEDGTFRPADNVTRAQAAAFIAKAKGLTQDTAQANGFTDSAAIAGWAKGAVGAVVKAGYMGGYQDGTFRADNALTRAEAVSMLDRVLKDQSDDLVITEPGTVVKDKTVAGDVIIAASVGSGDVTLDNVTIHGDLLVKGGGANSVHLKDTKVKGTVYAQRTAGTVRIVVEAATQLDRVVVLNGTHLQAASDFKGTIKEVVIDEQASSTQAITIDAKTDKVEIQANVAVTIKEDAKQVVLSDTAEKAKVTVADNAKVETLTVDAPKATVEIASGAKVETLTANEAVDINGSGSIGKLEANASNVTTEIKPDKTETAPSVKDPVIDNSTSGGGGGSSSGGGGGSTVKTETVTTADELNNALKDTTVGVIKVSGTIGDANNYGAYYVDRVVTVQGETGATVHGSFVVRANATIQNLTINNEGCSTHPGKNAIDIVGTAATIKNNTLNLGNEAAVVANGIVIWPTAGNGAGLVIQGNKINGYKGDNNKWTSVGMLVAENITVDAGLLKDATAPITTSDLNLAYDQEKELATGNTYTGCDSDYSRTNYKVDQTGKKEFVVVSNANRLNNLFTGTILLDEGAAVVLNDDIPMGDKHIVIPVKGLIFDGNGQTLTFTSKNNENVVDCGIVVQSNDVTVKDLTVTMTGANEGWKGCYALQAYNVKDITFENITANGADGAMYVNGADVTLKGAINVSGNEYGGIEVSRGASLASTDAKGELTIDNVTWTNSDEKYLEPTIWIVKEQGTINGGNFTTLEVSKKDGDQTQYYLKAENANGDTTIVGGEELTTKDENGTYKASFTWSSTKGIGTANGYTPESSDYTYYTNGAYLRFQVTDKDGKVKAFDEVFADVDGETHENDDKGGMTLQTDNGNVNDMDGSMRELADWTNNMNDSKKTNLPNDTDSKYVFYGLIQNKDVGTKTVGFNAGDSRTVNMTLTPKADLEAGKYTVTVEAMQQGKNEPFGAPITFEFTVSEPVPNMVLTSASLNADNVVKLDAEKTDGNAPKEVVEPSGDAKDPADSTSSPELTKDPADSAGALDTQQTQEQGGTEDPADVPETPAE